jgi:nucleotide-binding universal stress UspA family protein
MEALASHLKTLAYHTYIREGGVWEALSEIVRTHEIDLLVVGTHGRTGVGKLVLGSKAEEVLRQATCPVLTIGPKIARRSKLPAIEGDGKELSPVDSSVHQIVYASDFSPESLTAAPFAASLAQEFQAKLTLLHVIQEFEDTGRRPRLIDVALQRLEDLVPEKASLWYSPRPVVQFGSPAHCILQEAVDLKADLIVLGVRSAAGHLAAATHLPWTTAHKVIVHAPCPVLTVPFTAAVESKKEREGS